MINSKFEVYKVKREIKRNPKKITFYRNYLNEFGEPTGEYVMLKTITGLYYEHSAHYLDTYVLPMVTEYGISRTSKTPQLLCMYEDQFFDIINEAGSKEVDCLKVGDFADINGQMSKITGTFNIQEWNKLLTISFQEVDYGSKSLLSAGQGPNSGKIIQSQQADG